jgi:CRP/FNR family transcriptional regulator, anaerobic regulatory protein
MEVSMLQINPTVPHRTIRKPESRNTLREVFELIGLGDIDSGQFCDVEVSSRRLRAGQSLFAQDNPFDAVYVVRFGTLKTFTVDDDGHEQILGFSLRGDLLGADAAAIGHYGCYATAIEDSEVLVIPFAEVTALPDLGAQFERHLLLSLSRALNREHQLLAMIGTLSADTRVARFLADLSDRYAAMGYSASEFLLRMTRQEIANHLGLTMETVSRAFSNLSRAGLIDANQRAVRVIDPKGLRQGRLPIARARPTSLALQ